MEFSNLLNKCNLSAICDRLANDLEFFEYPERESYEKTVRKAEDDIFGYWDDGEKSVKDQDRIDERVGLAVTVLRRTFFEMGLIAGIKISHELSARAKELEK